MALRQIVCLANSYKHGNRCVAGLDVGTGKWVPPVSALPDGSLEERYYKYKDGRSVAPLDVISIDLTVPCPRNCHPEDWRFSEKPWQFIRHMDSPSEWKWLGRYLSKDITILQGYSDRIYATRVEKEARKHSLTLIQPDDLWWWIRLTDGRKKIRALFRRRRIRYDLAVTDPMWVAKLNEFPEGLHSHETVVRENASETYLAISLGEEFQGFHYKLVAGVVPIPIRQVV